MHILSLSLILNTTINILKLKGKNVKNTTCVEKYIQMEYENNISLNFLSKYDYQFLKVFFCCMWDGFAVLRK